MKARKSEKKDRNNVGNEAAINQRAEMLRSWNWKALPRAYLGQLHRPATVWPHPTSRPRSSTINDTGSPAKPLVRSQDVRVMPGLYNRTSSTIAEAMYTRTEPNDACKGAMPPIHVREPRPLLTAFITTSYAEQPIRPRPLHIHA